MSDLVVIEEMNVEVIERHAKAHAAQVNRPAYAIAATFPGNGTIKLPFSGRAVLMGFSIFGNGAYTAGSLFDGQDANGQILTSFAAQNGGIDRQWFGPGGVLITSGLVIQFSAAIIGTVWVRTAVHPPAQ